MDYSKLKPETLLSPKLFDGVLLLKVTNEMEKHHGFQYRNGLNGLRGGFAIEGSCCPGGFYFTTKENIANYYTYGCNVRVVTLPKDAHVVLDPEGDKFRSDKLILHEKYDLFLPSTFKKLDIPMMGKYMVYILGKLSKKNDIIRLKLWFESEFEIKCPSSAVERACKDGDIEMLKLWFKGAQKYGFKIEYTIGAIDMACYYDHIELLKFWFESAQKYELGIEYTTAVIDRASKYGHIEVLEFCFEYAQKYEFEIRYTIDAIDRACKYGHIKVLQFWFDNASQFELPLKYTERAIDGACSNGHTEILELWFNNASTFIPVYEDAIYFACQNGHIEILKLWFKNISKLGLELKYTQCAIKVACESHNVDALKLWVEYGPKLKLKYVEDATNWLRAYGYL